jgi:hypothetical protein
MTNIPENCKVENQKAFTITVSEEEAKTIQKALNKAFKNGNYDVEYTEMLTAQEYVENYLLLDAEIMIDQYDPYNV